MNIIIDDEESKRLQKQSKLLKRRNSIRNRDDAKDDYSSESSSESSECLSLRYESMGLDAKNLMNEYIDVVLKTREMYIDQHINNPGYYSLVVSWFNSIKKFYK